MPSAAERPTNYHPPGPRLRDPALLMRPERLAALQPSRVSASRALIARAMKGRWKITRTAFDLDERARGAACYRIEADGWEFSFPVFSFEPSGQLRTFRIIGRSWDMMGALVEGHISKTDMDLTCQEMPKLYHGRATPGTLVWCRANRSARVLDYCVESLAGGAQPRTDIMAAASYAMRNTGLDGNGTFGTRSFAALERGHPLRASLAAQMLAAYMMRVFAYDLIEHLSRARGGARTVAMNSDLARFLGIGNGSALGLMFFVHNHPRLLDRWLSIREQAIAAAKALEIGRDAAPLDLALRLIDRAIVYRRQDKTEYDRLTSSAAIADDLQRIRTELGRLRDRLRAGAASTPTPLVEFCDSIEGRFNADAIETLNSLLIELVPDLADRLVQTLIVDEELVGRPEMPVARLRDIVRAEYRWAFDLDLTSERSRRYIWYKSVNAEEPRRGPREEAPEALSLGLDLPRLIVALDRDLAEADGKSSVARFLIAHPEHRLIATRVQALAGLPYHSPHADIMSEDFMPAHITRMLNGAVHGLDKTRDAMGRVIRGVIMQGAPLPEELAAGAGDPHWFNPPEPRVS
ncbi:MAG TPA: hypothetical protein VKU03_13295 [Roseiarcus sp.]|nr:hypothetical protein [Roseiarcus sp.]